MSVDEITDWMAYEVSQSDSFKKRQKEKAIIAKNKEQEAEAIKRLFAGLINNG